MKYKKLENFKKGFTLIEVIIYCSIFVVFAIVSIQMMIWIGGKLGSAEYVSIKIKENIYKATFSGIYHRYKMSNQKVEDAFGYLLSSSTIQKFDSNLHGIVSNKTGEFEMFDSIDFDL